MVFSFSTIGWKGGGNSDLYTISKALKLLKGCFFPLSFLKVVLDPQIVQISSTTPSITLKNCRGGEDRPILTQIW